MEFTNEYDKLTDNILVTENTCMEFVMNNDGYTQVNMQKGGWKVILEFPKEKAKEDAIKDVKNILICTLNEQIQVKKIS